MDAFCPQWEWMDVSDKFNTLSDLWDTLPDALRKKAYRETCLQQETELMGTTEYNCDTHGTYEQYLQSYDYQVWLSSCAKVPPVTGEDFSHSGKFACDNITCEGCRFDYPMGHPSQRYHTGIGGCLNEDQ